MCILKISQVIASEVYHGKVKSYNDDIYDMDLSLKPTKVEPNGLLVSVTGSKLDLRLLSFKIFFPSRTSKEKIIKY